MAPQILFSCCVCDDEFASVSTLHYHQMCLHTTEELSLAILSIRELTVNASPAAGSGGVTGNAASPSTDCEDKLLRNGLAKYPRFLNSGGNRKSKALNSESRHGSTDDTRDTPKNLVTDKENIVLNNAVDINSEIGRGGNKSAGGKVDENDVCKERGEPVRSKLWGAIKTLDGKAVDAPVVKIDKKRTSNRFTTLACDKADRNDSPVYRDSFASKDNNDPSVSHDSLGKEKVLEKHLKLMNMSSFDDCIELECSDDSDDNASNLNADASDDEVNISEVKEEGSSVQEEEVKTGNLSDIKGEDSVEYPGKFKVLRSKRIRGKIQKHRTWYKGGSFQVSSIAKSPKNSISISNEGKSCESHDPQLEGKVKSREISSANLNAAKMLTDSCVQTDNFFFEEVSNSVVKMLEANKMKSSNDKAKSSHKKTSPRKKYSLGSREKNPKDKNSKCDSVMVKEEPMPIESLRIKSEVVEMDGEKRFYCNDCAKTYKKRSHLERHKRVHTGERPFVCPYCDKGFSVRSILNQHIRIHTGEKPYACTICAARFPQKSGLMTHMMLHTGKPFKCDQCDKAFVSNHKLVHHLKNHSGDRPHVCGICTSAFFTAAALDDHKTLHSRNRKHICQKCNASFVHEVYLKIHLATHLLEADCENETGEVDIGDMSPNRSTSPQSNTGQHSGLTLTLDAIDQFCNGETIMMDLSV